MRIYLDNCCLGRLLDDDSQDRVKLEIEAMMLLMARIFRKKLIWVSSSVLRVEVMRNRDLLKQRSIASLLKYASELVEMGPADMDRADFLQTLGFGVFDSYHLAAAERAGCDALLTTDDAFGRRAKRHAHKLHVRVENPIDWLMEVADHEDA